jgi:hypothetical protein
MYTVVKRSSRHLLWEVTLYNMVEQAVWRKTLLHTQAMFSSLCQYYSKFLFGVHSITSEKSILQSSQGVNLKKKN